MTTSAATAAATAGNVTKFEVRDGIRRVSCTVLDDALDAASGLATPSTPALRRTSFDRFRTLINAAATLKIRALPAGAVGPIVLTKDDLRRVPPSAGVPSFGSHPRGMARSVPVTAPTPVPAADAPPALTGPALSAYLDRQEQARAAARSGGSPIALESSLADISAEVTAEAVERRLRAGLRD